MLEIKQRIQNGEIVHAIGVPMDIEKGELTDILSKHDCDYLNFERYKTASNTYSIR